jgi:transposase
MEFICKKTDICPYKKELNDLKEELALVRFELEDLKSKRYKPKNPPKDKDTPQTSPKKQGGLLGHVGWFRKNPKRIDRIQAITLDRCPVCGCQDLTRCKGTIEHIQEVIVLPKTQITKFIKHRYYCKNCKQTITAKADNELSRSYIGPMAKAFAVFLRYVVKVSDRDVVNIFDKAFNLNIKASSIAGFRDQLKKHAKDTYHQLLGVLKESSFIHADETGWNISGINHWLWKFSNKKLSVTHIDKSREQRVVEDILGDDYKGVLITDFLSAYNKIKTKSKQKCLVHILRDLDKVVRYFHDDREVLRYCRKLIKLFEKAISLHNDYRDKTWDNLYCRKRQLITQHLLDFQFPNPSKKVLQRFVKRLNKYKDELFTFLYEKNIDYHNNHAEQQIRPDVIFRKITFQNRSLKGAENHQVLMSILQTAKLNNIDPIKALTQILNNKNPLSKVIASSKRSPPQVNYAG